jgi:hypothetical protein
MAQARNRTRVGHVEPGEVRRIGIRHAVVVLPVEARVVDMNGPRVELAQIDRKLDELKKMQRRLEARRTELADTIAQFDALPIERQDDDPVVPVEARAKAEPAEAEPER